MTQPSRPICFSAPAARMVMPYYELLNQACAGREGTGPKLPEVFKPLRKGGLPRRDGVSFAYMWSQIRVLDRELVIGIPT